MARGTTVEPGERPAPWRVSAVEEHLLLALAAGQMGTWDWDISADLLVWSDPTAALRGSPTSFEAPMSVLLEWVHVDDRDDVAAALTSLRAGRTEMTVQFRATQAGQLRWFVTRAKLHSDEHGGRTRAVGIVADVTDQHQAEDALRASEAFLGAVVEHLPDMVIVKDAVELRYMHLNRAAEDLLARPRDELIGRRDFDLFPASQAERFAVDDRHALASGSAVESPIEAIETRRGRRVLQTKKVPLYDADGLPRYVLSISTDVTDTEAAMVLISAEHQERLARVRHVLARRDLQMVFQPIVDLGSGQVVGVEALCRFPDERRATEAWFAEAAAVGLGVELELAAIGEAIARLPCLPSNTYMSVNLSPATVLAPALMPVLESVPNNRLVIELTEHTAVENYERLLAALGRLRAGGARLAVDDAGAGFASLRHILRLRPDIIKLDAALTSGIDDDPARRALASALVGFQRDVGATIVAEGIETQAELDALRSLGVTYGQGFFLGTPASLPLPRAPQLRRIVAEADLWTAPNECLSRHELRSTERQ